MWTASPAHFGVSLAGLPCPPSGEAWLTAAPRAGAGVQTVGEGPVGSWGCGSAQVGLCTHATGSRAPACAFPAIFTRHKGSLFLFLPLKDVRTEASVLADGTWSEGAAALPALGRVHARSCK